jgi:succinate dehydrogenase/fumarate reductase cytochrome b subunit
VLAVLYGAAVGMVGTSTDFATALATLKDLHLPAAFWFSIKAACAFPLCYHYLNGIRHLVG